jgi:hypothetical protein
VVLRVEEETRMNENMLENLRMKMVHVQHEQQEVQLLRICDSDIHPRFQSAEYANPDAYDPLDCWHYG